MSSAQDVLQKYGPLADVPEIRDPIEARYRVRDSKSSAYKALSIAFAVLGCGGSVIGGVVLIVLGAKAAPLSVAYIVSGSLVVPVGFIGFAISSYLAHDKRNHWRYHFDERDLVSSEHIKTYCNEAKLKEISWQTWLANSEQVASHIFQPFIDDITAQGTKKIPAELLTILRKRKHTELPLKSGYVSAYTRLKYPYENPQYDTELARQMKSSKQDCEAFMNHADTWSYQILLRLVSQLPPKEWIEYEYFLSAVANHPTLFTDHQAESLQLPAPFLDILAKLAAKAGKDPEPFAAAQTRRAELEEIFSVAHNDDDIL